ncbi:triose-phosphate isomerase [Patescibacteria group bacterium]|nr:triose-phosphate isomerase [Patescibacteria group bacterium]
MKTLIVANWKTNPQTLRGAKKLFNSVKRGARNIKRTEIVICPPFVFLSNIQYLTSNIKLGAQDVFWEKEGAYTGEVSSSMLKDIGCQYVIIGHSERRRYFKETDEIINKKLKAALAAKLRPILCIGETQREREQGKTESILRNQIVSDLKGISKARFSRVIVAYEPIWAIGTGRPCDVEEAQKMGLLIRKIISKIYNQAVSKNVRILYGGSVNSKNAAGYIKEAGLQGLLVGGASLKAKEFIKIVKII